MKTTMASLEFEQSTLPSDDDGRQRERERERTKRRDKPVNNVNKRATMKASFADIKFDRMKNLQVTSLAQTLTLWCVSFLRRVNFEVYLTTL